MSIKCRNNCCDYEYVEFEKKSISLEKAIIKINCDCRNIQTFKFTNLNDEIEQNCCYSPKLEYLYCIEDEERQDHDVLNIAFECANCNSRVEIPFSPEPKRKLTNQLFYINNEDGNNYRFKTDEVLTPFEMKLLAIEPYSKNLDLPKEQDYDCRFDYEAAVLDIIDDLEDWEQTFKDIECAYIDFDNIHNSKFYVNEFNEGIELKHSETIDFDFYKRLFCGLRDNYDIKVDFEIDFISRHESDEDSITIERMEITINDKQYYFCEIFDGITNEKSIIDEYLKEEFEEFNYINGELNDRYEYEMSSGNRSL